MSIFEFSKDGSIFEVEKHITTAIETIKKPINIERLTQAANELQVASLDAAEVAVEMLLQARKMKTRMDVARDIVFQPYSAFESAINRVISEVENEFEKIETNIREKLTAFLNSPNPSAKILCKIVTNDGSMTRSKKWAYEIEDEKKIAREFLKVDEKKLAAIIKAGIRQIDGLKIYETEEISFRVKN